MENLTHVLIPEYIDVFQRDKGSLLEYWRYWNISTGLLGPLGEMS